LPPSEPPSWKRLSTRLVYKNPWITVHEDEVQLPNGSTTIYGIVAANRDFVGVVPFLDPETVLLVRQYRYIQDEVTWEIPTGGIEPDETPEQAAQRELSEEAGYKAESLTLVNIMRSNKAIMREVGYIFAAEDLRASPAPPDETEDIALVPIALDEALAMVARYEITDCVSIIGLLMADKRRKSI
jgi:8-oxo-dGTP pyrophosphatase MutT (NUDIX family)